MTKQNMTLEQEIAKLKAENEALKASRTKGLSIKLGKSGTVCVYGLMRFPVSLYHEQWETLLNYGQSIREFIEAHKSEFPTKEESKLRAAQAKLDAAKAEKVA